MSIWPWCCPWPGIFLNDQPNFCKVWISDEKLHWLPMEIVVWCYFSSPRIIMVCSYNVTYVVFSSAGEWWFFRWLRLPSYLPMLCTMSGYYRILLPLINKSIMSQKADRKQIWMIYWHIIGLSKLTRRILGLIVQESRTLEMNNVQDGVWHGRGDTICVGSFGEGSKEFFALQKPSLLPTVSPEYIIMDRASSASSHSWNMDARQSEPLVLSAQSGQT